MGEALRRNGPARRGWRRALVGILTSLLVAAASAAGQDQQLRLQQGRFTVLADPSDAVLARAVLNASALNDTFPGLPRPREDVTIVIARDAQRMRELSGPGTPEWGIAVAIPALRRIVIQGRGATSAAGDPLVAVRHELAHLALHELMGDLPPRWFDEGYATYAAGEWRRDDALATQVALALRGVPTLQGVDSAFYGGATRAQYAYALAHRAVADLASLDPKRGLSLLFTEWRARGSLDAAMRHAYAITLGSYEAMWRRRTRRRYGALAVVTDLTLAVVILLAVVAPLYVARRRRDQKRLATMRERDVEAEQRERDSAIEALLRSSSGDGSSPTPPPASEEPST
ncbi:MAG: peptidase MA family metallohydrolase [Gemmatimonadaceae bacterium]